MNTPATRILDLFKQPSPLQVAAASLLEAEHGLLAAHADAEWAQSRIAAYEVRIARLQAYIIAMEARRP